PPLMRDLMRDAARHEIDALRIERVDEEAARFVEEDHAGRRVTGERHVRRRLDDAQLAMRIRSEPAREKSERGRRGVARASDVHLVTGVIKNADVDACVRAALLLVTCGCDREEVEPEGPDLLTRV